MESSLSKTDVSVADQTRPKIRHPRPAWQEAILMFFTGGIYVCFWLIGRARDLKQAGNPEMTPWLWFFPPLLGIVQLFAFPVMFERLSKLETPEQAPQWAKYGGVWVALLFISSIAISISDRFGLSLWIFLTGFVVSIALYTLLHQRFNAWKSSLDSVDFFGRESGYTWYEWMLLLVVGFIVTASIYVLMIQPLTTTKIQQLENGQSLEHSDPEFSLQVFGNGWSQVEIGTFSDGSATMEFQGPKPLTYFIVFDWGVSHSLSSATQDRANYRDEFTGTPDCEETRRLSEQQDSVISYTECNGTNLGDPTVVFHSFIESNDRILELYGHTSATRYVIDNLKPDMQKTAQSFKPL